MELYFDDLDTGTPLTSERVRKLPIGRLEDFVNLPEERSLITALLTIEAIDLKRVAARYSTTPAQEPPPLPDRDAVAAARKAARHETSGRRRPHQHREPPAAGQTQHPPLPRQLLPPSRRRLPRRPTPRRRPRPVHRRGSRRPPHDRHLLDQRGTPPRLPRPSHQRQNRRNRRTHSPLHRPIPRNRAATPRRPHPPSPPRRHNPNPHRRLLRPTRTRNLGTRPTHQTLTTHHTQPSQPARHHHQDDCAKSRPQQAANAPAPPAHPRPLAREANESFLACSRVSPSGRVNRLNHAGPETLRRELSAAAGKRVRCGIC